MTESGSRHSRWIRRTAISFKVFVIAVAAVVISGSLYLLAWLAFDPLTAEEWTTGLQPTLFQSTIDPELLNFSDAAYASVFGVAHNSGGSLQATLEALIYGADVIEIDVVEIDGTLYSAHSSPLPFVGKEWFRGPRLDTIWTAAFGAEAVSLDLKESSPAYVALVGDFLATRAPYRKIIVTGRDSSVLAALRQRAPDVVYLLSVPNHEFLDRELRDNAATREAIDGVTIQESALDDETIAWLGEQRLLVFAWTVNDLERVNELIGLGVDGITTDSIAILTLLGGQDRGERDLVQSPSPGGDGAE